MAEYIEREPILKFIEDGLNNPDKLKAFGHDAIEIMTEVQYAPAADVAPVVHGLWKRRGDTKDETIYECSKCYRRVKVPHGISKERWAPYCHCGAKMDK